MSNKLCSLIRFFTFKCTTRGEMNTFQTLKASQRLRWSVITTCARMAITVSVENESVFVGMQIEAEDQTNRGTCCSWWFISRVVHVATLQLYTMFQKCIGMFRLFSLCSCSLYHCCKGAWLFIHSQDSPRLVYLLRNTGKSSGN